MNKINKQTDNKTKEKSISEFNSPKDKSKNVSASYDFSPKHSPSNSLKNSTEMAKEVIEKKGLYRIKECYNNPSTNNPQQPIAIMNKEIRETL